MTLLKGSTSFVEFSVPTGKLPEVDVHHFIRERVPAFAFRDIEDTFDDYSIGWVSPLNMFNSDFDPIVGDYVVMSLRVDERRVPSVVLKKYVAMAFDQERQEKQIPRLSRSRKIEIKERVKTELVRKAKPTPSVFEVVWDLDGNRALLLSTGKQAQELLQGLFTETFGINIEPVCPESVLPDEVNPREFLTWLWFRSDTGNAEFNDGGLIVDIGDKIQLESAAPGEKVACVNSYHEAMDALATGKQVEQMDLVLAIEGDISVQLTFAASTFYYKGVKLPKMGQEEDDGFVLERVYLFLKALDAMRNLLDSFVEIRTAPEWEIGEGQAFGGWCLGEEIR